MKKMFWFVLGLTMAVGCNDGFERDNPYDPDAPQGDPSTGHCQWPCAERVKAMTPIAHQHMEPPRCRCHHCRAGFDCGDTMKMVRSGLRAFQLDSGHSKLRQLSTTAQTLST